jgi:hypothetical protein
VNVGQLHRPDPKALPEVTRIARMVGMATVQPFLDVRTAVLNDTLEDAFRTRYPRFRPANDDDAIAAAA